MKLRLSFNSDRIVGRIQLPGSKSIANRALILNALSKDSQPFSNLSDSKDTQTLEQLLDQSGSNYDAGPAGTTFRFLTAYLALQPGTQTLTGSARMLERPIGPLVEALNSLGADISYSGKPGFPPLEIGPWQGNGTDSISIPANISSQFISALLMVGPRLPQGLKLQLQGKVVSKPYLEMTLALMKTFGADSVWEKDTIKIPVGEYVTPSGFNVESDWSAASYYYSMAAVAPVAEIELLGLSLQSVQGDSILPKLMKKFGVETYPTKGGVKIVKESPPKSFFEQDFLTCPDLAQTLAVCCGLCGVHGLFTGLETLKIKETDRIEALKNELKKISVKFIPIPRKFSRDTSKEWFLLEDKAELDSPTFETYHDHRMAMSFAPCAIVGPIFIKDPSVIEKSYPGFWKDLGSLGFSVEMLQS
ncbi:MAG: 3-phosphoshikimate 1-carboxyvinyltransferase [Saprospiraceae bacterium]|nr:3-phosphoshikimate 1-carboxyvinyltransferase [Saprospiraceae bacterium]